MLFNDYKRKLFKKIRPFYQSDLIKVITGIRRCGKSVILRQIISKLINTGISNDHVIYINFEDYDYSFIKSGQDLHEYIKKLINDDNKYFLFFDEIQMVDEFERVINSFKVKYNTSIFITGSNGKLLSGELATHLSGRYVGFKIFPFSFKEMLEYKGTLASDDLLIDYMTWGGLPQRFSFDDIEQVKIFLSDVFDTVVLRDIIQRSKIVDIALFNRIVEYLVCNPSQTFSIKSISDYFLKINRKVSSETIYNYLEYITSSLIMNRASRYDIRGKGVLTRLDKYYLTDLGLGRIKSSGFKLEMGALLKNVVYNELLTRGYDVYVGKVIGGEIDFVAIKGEEKGYYQVTYYLVNQEVIDREFNAFESIKDNFPKYVISFDKMDFSRNGIIHKNILDFLLEEN